MTRGGLWKADLGGKEQEAVAETPVDKRPAVLNGSVLVEGTVGKGMRHVSVFVFMMTFAFPNFKHCMVI